MRGATLAFLAAIALGQIARAEPFVAPDTFRDWTEGRTIRTDFADGAAFGVEEFGPNGSVVWHDRDGTCLTGQWRAEGGSICYRYDGQAEPSCLRYEAEGIHLIGYQWSNEQGPLGFTRLVLRLTATDDPPRGCGDVPVS